MSHLRLLYVTPIVAAALAFAVARADDPQPAPPEVRETLSNGLEVVVLPSARAKWAVVLTGYRAGARNEQPAEAGAAQLVARLLRSAPCGSRGEGAADQELAALGPKNANTPTTGCESFHELTYTWATVPPEKVGAVLDVEKDRLTALKPTAASLDAARQEVLSQPVKREVRAWNSLIALAFPGSSLGRPRLGSPDTVAAMTLDAVEAWRKAHIRVDAGLVVVAGVHDAKATLDLVKEKLGAVVKPETALEPAPAVPPATKGTARSTLDGPSTARHVWIAFRGPDPGSDDEAAFLAAVFALKDRVVSTLQGKAHEATVRADARSDAPTLLVVSASPRPAVPLIDVEARIRGAANTLRGEAPADLDRLKTRVEKMLASCTPPLDAALQNTKDEPDALLEAAVDRALAAPLVARREKLLANVRALTPDAFLAKAKTLLSEDRMSIVAVEPPGK